MTDRETLPLCAVTKEFCTPSNVRYDRYESVEQRSARWVELRKRALGSSMAAAVFPSDISATKKPWELHSWLRKEPTREVSEYQEDLFEQGRVMEPRLILELAHMLGISVVSLGLFRTLWEDADIHLVASPDGLAVCMTADGPRVAMVEIKWRSKAPSSECDNHSYNGLGYSWYAQVQHEMWLSGVGVALLYSGAHNGERSLWVVTLSHAYIHYWSTFARRAIFNAQNYEKAERFEGGAARECARYLDGLMSRSVRRVQLTEHSLRLYPLEWQARP